MNKETNTENKDLTATFGNAMLADVSLYKAENGDASIVIMLFASSKKEAKKIAKKYIKNEYNKDDFPVIDIIKIKNKKGVFETFNLNEY